VQGYAAATAAALDISDNKLALMVFVYCVIDFMLQ